MRTANKEHRVCLHVGTLGLCSSGFSSRLCLLLLGCFCVPFKGCCSRCCFALSTSVP